MFHKLTKSMAGASILTSFIGSCCALPLLLMGMGIGGSGLAATFAPLRPYFIAATVLLVGSSFYLIYARKTAPCDDPALCNPKSRKTTKIVLWLSVVLASVFLIGPYIIARLL